MTRRVQNENERAGHRKLKAAPAPSPRAIPIPDFVRILGPESGPIALAEWTRAVPLLEKMGSATAVDAYLLRVYCVCFARTLECEEEITREGKMVDGQRKGSRMKNPLITTGLAYLNVSRGICAQLGIGANARGVMNLKPPPAPEEDHSWLPAVQPWEP